MFWLLRQVGEFLLLFVINVDNMTLVRMEFHLHNFTPVLQCCLAVLERVGELASAVSAA